MSSGGPIVLLEPTLLAQFGVKVGDQVKLGRTLFTVAGALRKIPGESPGVAMMAPRAYIPMDSLAATGLSGSEALARHRAMVRLPAGRDADAIVTEMKARFPAMRLSFDTVEQRKRNLGQALNHLDGFLSLVGFVALILGGIGVASALHAYIREKISTVAVLRCLGASGSQGLSVYLVQGLALGLAGGCVGGALGVAVQMGLPALFRGMLPIDINFFISWPDVMRGTGAGVVICLLFSLMPLISVRRIPPLAALRSAVAERISVAPDPLRIALGAVIAASVAGFAIWQTRSVAVGLGFAGMLGLGCLILGGLALAVSWAARRFVPGALPYVVRQGFANLHRPNNRTVLLLLSLGLGTFLVLTLFLVRTTLLNEIRGSDAAGRPNLIFFDIQDDQIGPLVSIAAGAGSPVTETAPIVTMKIASVRGVTVEKMLADGHARIPAWALRREYRSTFRGLGGRDGATDAGYVYGSRRCGVGSRPHLRGGRACERHAAPPGRRDRLGCPGACRFDPASEASAQWNGAGWSRNFLRGLPGRGPSRQRRRPSSPRSIRRRRETRRRCRARWWTRSPMSPRSIWPWLSRRLMGSSPKSRSRSNSWRFSPWPQA